MNTKPQAGQKKPVIRTNTIETGNRSNQPFEKKLPANEQSSTQKERQANKSIRKEFSLFSYNQYFEREVVKKQIKELTELVKREIDLLKKAESSLLSDIKDAEKISVEQLPEKPGVYHIRFLEAILTVLKSLRAKVGESRTWLQSMTSRRKKRGSLFLSLSKKKGTQFSLSQELQATRAVQ